MLQLHANDADFSRSANRQQCGLLARLNRFLRGQPVALLVQHDHTPGLALFERCGDFLAQGVQLWTEPNYTNKGLAVVRDLAVLAGGMDPAGPVTNTVWIYNITSGSVTSGSWVRLLGVSCDAY